MAVFLTLEQAKTHLRVVDDLHDADVQAKLDEAEAAIVTYLGERFNAAWTPEDVPKVVVSAIQLRLSSLYDYTRGDPTKDANTWDAIRRMLAQLRDQALGVGAAASTP